MSECSLCEAERPNYSYACMECTHWIENNGGLDEVRDRGGSMVE